MTPRLSRYARLTAAFFTLLGAAAGAHAQTAPAGGGAAPVPSAYDRIWARFTQLYKDDGNPVVQQVLFSGRFHQDFVVVDADHGDLRESNVRRLRLGPRITLFRNFTLHAEVELNPQERNPFYTRVSDAYLQWNQSSRLVLTFGKQAMPFTNEGATSSRELLTIDRSAIGNNIWFPQEYLPGVSAAGRVRAEARTTVPSPSVTSRVQRRSGGRLVVARRKARTP